MPKLLFIFLLFCFDSFCQTNTVAAGNTIENNNGSFSFTIGQIDYLQSQGIQQPYLEIELIENLENSIEIDIFPNPTSSSISIVLSNFEMGLYFFELYDVNNKLISSKSIDNELFLYSLEDLTNASYYITIKESSTPIKQFKIVKQN
jgi:hypothetical protein